MCTLEKHEIKRERASRAIERATVKVTNSHKNIQTICKRFIDMHGAPPSIPYCVCDPCVMCLCARQCVQFRFNSIANLFQLVASSSVYWFSLFQLFLSRTRRSFWYWPFLVLGFWFYFSIFDFFSLRFAVCRAFGLIPYLLYGGGSDLFLCVHVCVCVRVFARANQSNVWIMQWRKLHFSQNVIFSLSILLHFFCYCSKIII